MEHVVGTANRLANGKTIGKVGESNQFNIQIIDQLGVGPVANQAGHLKPSAEPHSDQVGSDKACTAGDDDSFALHKGILTCFLLGMTFIF